MSGSAESLIVVDPGSDDVTTIGLTPHDVSADQLAAWWASITRVVARFGGQSLDSATAPAGSIDWSGGAIALRLGRISGVAPGEHDFRLRVYTPTAPAGLSVWRGLPRIQVRKPL